MSPRRAGSGDGGRLLVVGAGTMGAQIAQQAALSGIDVSLVDVDAEHLQRAMASNRSMRAPAPRACSFRRSSSRAGRAERSSSSDDRSVRASATLRPSDATKSARAPPSPSLFEGSRVGGVTCPFVAELSGAFVSASLAISWS